MLVMYALQYANKYTYHATWKQAISYLNGLLEQPAPVCPEFMLEKCDMEYIIVNKFNEAGTLITKLRNGKSIGIDTK